MEIISQNVSSIDDLDGQSVETNAIYSPYWHRAVVTLDTDADAMYDKGTARLTPAAARALAAQLLDLADKADEIDAERA